MDVCPNCGMDKTYPLSRMFRCGSNPYSVTIICKTIRELKDEVSNLTEIVSELEASEGIRSYDTFPDEEGL